jgi:hypothetical protein
MEGCDEYRYNHELPERCHTEFKTVSDEASENHNFTNSNHMILVHYASDVVVPLRVVFPLV